MILRRMVKAAPSSLHQVPPLEAAVKWLDANTTIQTKKLVGCQCSNTNKKLVGCQHNNANKKNWLDANTAIHTNKKIGWMPTQHYKHKNQLQWGVK